MLRVHEVRRRPMATLAERRWLYVASMALLFLAGPVHIWHHVEEGAGTTGTTGDESHCLPCSAFHKTHFVTVIASNFLSDWVCWGIVESGPDSPSSAVELSVAASRAPPSLG